MVSICHERWNVLISNNSAFKKTITWSWLIDYRSTIAKYLANFPTLTENEVTPSKNNNTHSLIQKEKRLVLSSRNSVTYFRLQPVIRYENNIFTFGSITKLPKTVDLQIKFVAVIFCSLHFIRLNERKEAFDGINLICYRPLCSDFGEGEDLQLKPMAAFCRAGWNSGGLMHWTRPSPKGRKQPVYQMLTFMLF